MIQNLFIKIEGVMNCNLTLKPDNLVFNKQLLKVKLPKIDWFRQITDSLTEMKQGNNLYENILHKFKRKELQSMKNEPKLRRYLQGLIYQHFLGALCCNQADPVPSILLE